MTIFVAEADRDMVRQLLADRDGVVAACKAAGPEAYKAPEIQSYFKNSNRTFAAFLSPLFDHASFIFGESIARQVCKLYGGGSSPDAVAPQKLADTFAQFVRLTDPYLIAARPRVKPSSYIAPAGFEARLLKLEMAAADAARAEKADRLKRKLWDLTEAFAGIDSYCDLGIGYVPTSFESWLYSGLMRATVGDFKAPCSKGLGELESILKQPFGSDRMRKLAAKYRASKAAQWATLEEFAEAQLEKLDGKAHDRLRAVLDVAKSAGRNLYPAQSGFLEVFEDKSNAPDATLDEFQRMRGDFVALRNAWFAYNRANYPEPEPEPETLRATARIVD